MKKNILLFIKSALFLIVCWLAGMFICMFFPNSYKDYGNIMCFIFGFCSVGAMVCIYADWTHKLGAKTRVKTDTEEKIKKQQHFGLYLGLVPTAINYIYFIILCLSKFGAVDFDFFPIYKTLTFYFVPLIYLVAPDTISYVDGAVTSTPVPATELSLGAMIMFAILPLIFCVTTWVSYYVGYNHIDLKERITYRK